MPYGQIKKAVSGFYFVQTENGEEIRCRARGVFKYEKKKQHPLVGDVVEWKSTGLDEGVITWIQPRHSELIRPPIANITQAVVISSLREPNFQSMLLDRFLVHAEKEQLKVVICLTKRDLVSNQKELEEIHQIYEATAYPVISTSIETGEGIEELHQKLQDEISVLAGASGVGKSSLLNHMLPQLQLATGSVSKKLGQGRHTTRQIELLSLPTGGQVADTPGFRQLDFHEMEAEDLRNTFPEFSAYSPSCRYRSCFHINEPGCKVKEAVDAKKIHPLRHQHYVQFLEEIRQQVKRRY